MNVRSRVFTMHKPGIKGLLRYILQIFNKIGRHIGKYMASHAQLTGTFPAFVLLE